MSLFLKGARAMTPIIFGVIPFGLVMGTVSANSKLDLFQTIGMNVLVFAGSSQLAAIDLMTKDAESLVIILTGLIINMRFVLYSAALSPVVQEASLGTKFLSAYFLTDQTYAAMSAQGDQLQNSQEKIIFYFGAALCMAVAWQISVVVGFIFGNIAPSSWALDYAVPLSFVALVAPTLKNKKYVYVALFSSAASILLHPMPYNLGLILASLLALGFGIRLTQQKDQG
jgi:predicted branched-subunit amino acid permease